MTIGTELREARERLGLSREHISLATKIQVGKVAALEEDAFDSLPSGIYLDGIVAAYAREVGRDGEALVQRLRVQLAPPPPETLEQIAAARQSSRRHAFEWRFGLAHGMFAFAGVVVVLAILGMAVDLFPRQSSSESEQTIASARTGTATSGVAQETPISTDSQAKQQPRALNLSTLNPCPVEKLKCRRGSRNTHPCNHPPCRRGLSRSRWRWSRYQILPARGRLKRRSNRAACGR